MTKNVNEWDVDNGSRKKYKRFTLKNIEMSYWIERLKSVVLNTETCFVNQTFQNWMNCIKDVFDLLLSRKELDDNSKIWAILGGKW